MPSSRRCSKAQQRMQQQGEVAEAQRLMQGTTLQPTEVCTTTSNNLDHTPYAADKSSLVSKYIKPRLLVGPAYGWLACKCTQPATTRQDAPIHLIDGQQMLQRFTVHKPGPAGGQNGTPSAAPSSSTHVRRMFLHGAAIVV
jgi:hypothetical protein